jgi:nucleotide-binding universal stress UspA family protein
LGPIVVGVDGSLPSEHALYLSVGFAHREGVRLVAVHVRRPVQSGVAEALAPCEIIAAGREVTEDLARTAVEEACEAAGVMWEFRVRTGSPAPELREVAHEVRAGLLVIGTRGAGLAARWHRITSGSVSAHLVRHETTPVLVVR